MINPYFSLKFKAIHESAKSANPGTFAEKVIAGEKNRSWCEKRVLDQGKTIPGPGKIIPGKEKSLMAVHHDAAGLIQGR